MAHGSAGRAELVGDWIELSFPYDIRLNHELRGLAGRRLAIGKWRIPTSRLPELALRLRGFDIDWVGDAGEAFRHHLLMEDRAAREDQVALAAKAGQAPIGEWSSPVDLLPHQRVAVEFLVARSGALLCDEQGLGKTLSSLVAFWLLRSRGAAQRLLVVCPSSLKATWRAELNRFFPDWSVAVASGYKRQRQKAYESDADVCIVNYEAARGDFADLRLLLRRKKTVLVCDESHTAKNTGSRTSRSLTFVRSAAERVWVMSGTPIPNSLADAYGQVFLADGGRLLGTEARFRSQYLTSDDPDDAARQLNQVLAPILLRRTKEDAIDLPDKTFIDRFVELPPGQRAFYEELREDLSNDVGSMSEARFRAERPNILLRLLRLSQVAANPRLIRPSYEGLPAKHAEIDQLLQDLIHANKRKVVLWSYYVRSIEELLARYSGYSPVAIYGRIPLDERAAAVRRFQEDDKAMLMVANPQAAATGLTLTAAHYAIYETLTWRYDLYAQSLDRIHRIGQTTNVTYIHVLAEATLDSDVLSRLRKKADIAAAALGDGQAGRDLDRDEVMRMLRHRDN